MRYNPSLDGIRAVAVGLVMLFHSAAPGWQGGYIGVDVFFVLSGFLITSQLLRELETTGDVRITQFYARRALRLAPAFATFCIVYAAIGWIVFPVTPFGAHIRDMLLGFFYISDYSHALFGPPNFLVHTWSLSVEEHYYLLWPLTLLGVWKLTRGRLVVVGLIVGLMLLVSENWRQLLVLSGASWDSAFYRFDSRLSSLLVGCLLACLVANQRFAAWWADRKALHVIAQSVALVSIFLLARALVWKDRDYLISFLPVIELGSAVLVGSLVMQPQIVTARLLALGPLRYLGRISYGLYLWHYPIMRWFKDSGFSWQETLLYGSAMGIAAAALSFHTVESLGRRLKARSLAVSPA